MSEAKEKDRILVQLQAHTWLRWLGVARMCSTLQPGVRRDKRPHERLDIPVIGIMRGFER